MMRFSAAGLFLLIGALCLPAQADVKMPGIFGDHMVLQQGAKLPIWGWAAPGEQVTVTFADQSGQATAANDGTWRVDLTPVPANGEGQVLKVSGKNTVTFQDVLVGDVWIVSGQSNMEFGIQKEAHAAAEIPKANDPQLRLFFVPWNTSLQPNADLGAASANSLNGKWQVCTPQVMAASWGWNGFSAVGYYFARDIRASQGKPVGMIATYKGGTAAQSWTSISGLEKDPLFADYVETHQKLVDGYDQAKIDLVKKTADFQATLKQWNDDTAKAKADGIAFAKPRPKEPTPADGGYGSPGNLFNAMVAPLMPFAIKGVIWYQGESNGDTLDAAAQYATLFPRLIADWREKWGQGDFPFLYIELAKYTSAKDPGISVWPWVRDAQAKTLSLPATGMATAVDIGDPTYIHPADKLDVGKRLALVARRVAYGEDIVATGPVYDAMKVEGNTVRLTFKSRGGGLVLGVPPWTYDNSTPPAPTALTGFLAAGADRKFVPATAAIDGDTVVVTAPDGVQPVAVRYAWYDCPEGDLYNKDGLPASPFRTDDWEPGPLTSLSTTPNAGGGGWLPKFQGNVNASKGKQFDLLFDGDSITDWFQTTGKDVWTKYYGGRKAFDFAIAGDRTQNLLYRLEHGQLDGMDPKLVVLLIGTNNTVSDNADQIVDGIKACVDGYLKRCPNAHLLLLNVFPRRTVGDILRLRVNEVNAKLEKVDFGDRVTRVDFGSVFLQDDKTTINLDLMPGRLHPGAAGYEAWAAAMEPAIAQFVPAK